MSVEYIGQTVVRAETEWERAVTVWEGGATDDEGLVRVCSPDCFPGRAEYLRQDLKRMVREYRHGTRECHSLTPASAAMPVQVPSDVERIEQRLDVLTTAVQQVGVRKADTPSPVTDTTLRREFAPVVAAMTKAVRKWDEVAPNLSKDGKPMTREGVRKALLRFERKTGQRGLFSKITYHEKLTVG